MKRLVVALGIALVVASAVLVWLLGESRGQRRVTRELEGRLVALQSAPGATAAAWTAPAPEGRPSTEVGAGGTHSDSADAASMAAAFERVRDSPEGREFARVMLRMTIDQQYPDARRELGLSQEETEELFDLLADRMADDQAGLRAGGNAPDGVSREEREFNYERQVEALLGDRYPRWQQYQQTLGQRRAENWKRLAEVELRGVIGSADQPVDDAQFQNLQAALAAEESRFNQEVRAATGMQQHVQRMSALNRRLVDAASAHLDAPQLERYRRHLQQQEEMMRLSLRAADATGTRVESD